TPIAATPVLATPTLAATPVTAWPRRDYRRGQRHRNKAAEEKYAFCIHRLFQLRLKEPSILMGPRSHDQGRSAGLKSSDRKIGCVRVPPPAVFPLVGWDFTKAAQDSILDA